MYVVITTSTVRLARFSRAALTEALETTGAKCPSCNGDLFEFDVVSSARNVLLAGLVETMRGGHGDNVPAAAPARTPTPTLRGHRWECSAHPVTPDSTMHEVTLTLEDGVFSTRPSLFIAVLDRSGSMRGRAGEQVGTALRHIHALAKSNPQSTLVMLSYGSDCIEITQPEQYRVNGGTNFRAAFRSIDEVLRRYAHVDADAPANGGKPVIGAVHIAFLTDGQDGSGDRATLVPEFRYRDPTCFTMDSRPHAACVYHTELRHAPDSYQGNAPDEMGREPACGSCNWV